MKTRKRKRSSEDVNQSALLTKPQIAKQLQVSTRSIENMMRQRIIPFIRVTKRSVRFHLPRVLTALSKREVQEK